MDDDEMMSFAEARAMMLSMPASDNLAIGAFQNLLRGNCTEEEAKIWMAAHIWDFPEDMRDDFVKAFATDALYQAGKKAQQTSRPQQNTAALNPQAKSSTRETIDRLMGKLNETLYEILEHTKSEKLARDMSAFALKMTLEKWTAEHPGTTLRR